MNENALKGMLGLAMRAGFVVLGTDMALTAVRKKTVRVLLIDEGASDNTKKKVLDAASFYNLPYFMVREDLLNEACGKDGRAVAAVKNGSFAQKIISMLS